MRVDTLLMILTYTAACIAFASVAPYVGVLFLAAFVLLVLLALLADFRSITVLPRFVLNILAVIAVVLSLLRVDVENMILPGMETLSLLLPLKLLERKGPRDYLQIYFLAILLLAGSSLLSLDMIFVAYMAAFILLMGGGAILVACLAEDASLRLPGPAVKDIGRQTLIVTLIVIPVTALLFFVLPRTSYPFFDFLNRAAIARSGFSDSVKLGNVSQIQMDEAVVMRVAMERIDERSLYWRGIVFDHFDGTAWQAKDQKPGWRITYGTGGKSLRYTVYLEPSEYNSLITLDHPVYIMMRPLRRFDDYTYQAVFPLTKKIGYEALSVSNGVIDTPERHMGRYLDTPDGMMRIATLAAELTSNLDKPAAAERILRYLRDGNYSYALKNLPRSRNPLEDFLFTYRYGNCEYFASAMAVMLRFRGIPSRLIGGYRGGYYQDFGGYYVVPQRLAHVWVEAYLPDRGWVRFDPTPGVPGGSGPRLGLLFRLRMVLDLLEYNWNRAVINYDFQQQMSLFVKMPAFLKETSVQFTRTHGIILALLILCVLVVAAGRVLARRLFGRTREKRVLDNFSRRMGRLGYLKAAHQGLDEFVRSIPDGPVKDEASRFTTAFQDFYYNDKPLSRRDEKALRDIIRQIG